MLHKHSCTLPVKRTLIVWGPKSSGKTEGLLRATRFWIKSGRAVIHLNLKGFTGNYSKFVAQLRHLILEHVTSQSLSPSQLQILQTCINHDASILIPHEQPNGYIEIIFSEVQSLAKLGEQGVQLLTIMVETLEARKQPQSLVPVVFETSDALWASDTLLAPSVRRSREAFQGFMLSEFSREACAKKLVGQKLTEVQFDELWDALGGHAGSWVAVSTLIFTF
jgi:hypothetical protein